MGAARREQESLHLGLDAAQNLDDRARVAQRYQLPQLQEHHQSPREAQLHRFHAHPLCQSLHLQSNQIVGQ